MQVLILGFRRCHHFLGQWGQNPSWGLKQETFIISQFWKLDAQD